MRQAQFRLPPDRDWGLPPFTNADIWSDLRHALNQLKHHLFTHRAEGRRLRRYLAGRKGPVLVSIGSGRTVQPGWIGIDLKHGDRVFRCDLRKPLPLADASVDGILAEHVVEHFGPDDLPHMLAELCRVLKPSAPLRIVCPDAQIVAGLLTGEDSTRANAQLEFDTRVHGWDPGHELMRWRTANRLTYQFGQHQVLLTADTTAWLLHEAGFCGTRTMAITETVYFAQVPGTHLARFPDSAHEAFTVEAVRSPATPSHGAMVTAETATAANRS
ncbi:class I SAM-dependent methyltransferase [Actinoplanes sp. CA-054009]